MITSTDVPPARPEGSHPRSSTLIAEALVERQSPRQIVARACALGLPDPTMEVILAACGCTAGSAATPAPAWSGRAAPGPGGFHAR